MRRIRPSGGKRLNSPLPVTLPSSSEFRALNPVFPPRLRLPMPVLEMEPLKVACVSCTPNSPPM